MAFNILIVDDSSIIRSMLKKTFSAAGIPVGEVIEAGNGREGIEKLESNWVDLMFLDINMPVMDGMTMIDRMQDRDEFRDTPVVVVSTEGSRTKIDKLWGKGIKAFISKPFSPEKVRNIVRDVLGDWEEPDRGSF